MNDLEIFTEYLLEHLGGMPEQMPQGVLSDETFARALELLPALEAYVKCVKQLADITASSGINVPPGWKVQPGRKVSRRWVSEHVARQRLPEILEELGEDPEAMWDKKPVSVAEFEKRYGVMAIKRLEQYITQPTSSPKLVKEN